MKKKENRFKLICGVILVAIVVAISVIAFALDTKTIEQSMTYDVFSGTTGSVTSVFDIAGVGQGNVSTYTWRNIYGHSWKVLSLGSDATFTISYATKTYSSRAGAPTSFNNSFPPSLYGGAPSISTTTTIFLSSSVPVEGRFWDLTTNPIFISSNLATGSTFYLWVEFGRPKF